MITLQDLLDSKTDLFKNSRVKLVQHKDGREEYRELIKHRDTLLKYQAEQISPVFHGCDYIISLIGKERRKSILFGIFKVHGFEELNVRYFYNLEQVHEFDYLADRVVIDWGKAAINWHQWYNQTKEVVEILPAGYLGNFPGLLGFVLEADELQKLINNPEANADWKHHLSAVNGVYLILDRKTGLQYISSACGKEGIWQRWSEYAKIWYGGNTELKKLYDEDAGYNRHFYYCVLQALPSNVTQREIVKIENLYKEKFGSRMHGLNLN